MPTHDVRFKEIEHKYEVADDFDLDRFRAAVMAMRPIRTNAIQVRDRYFLTETGRQSRFLLRHRLDTEIQQLTLKSLGDDTEVRDEVNLDLGHHAGDQSLAVDAFVHYLGVRWSGTITKDIAVWYFDDCEVVHYRATTGARAVRCVEFEATRKDSVADALAIVERYERATGLHGLGRSRASLPQLLFPELRDLLVV